MNTKHKLIWNKVLDLINENITSDQYQTWFSKLKVNSFTKRYVRIVVPNLFVKECLTNNYLKLINSSIKKVCEIEPEIVFLCNSETVAKNKKKLKPRKRDIFNDHISTLNRNFTFDNFVVGNCNMLANAAAQSIIESPGYMYNPLYIHGPTGMGKTHLLQSIYISYLLRTNNENAMYITCQDLINEMISSVKNGNIDEFRKIFREVDILLIDDIQFLADSEKTKDEFFHAFNSLFNSHKQIVISSDRLPEEIPNIEERLISRFNWGLKCKLEPPDMETSSAILDKKSSSLGVKLPLDVRQFIAENITSNIREIEGTILKIKESASVSKQQITLDLVKSVLYEYINDKKNISVETILKVISSEFDLNVTRLLSKNRTKSVTLPRQIAMYLTRKMTDLSYNEIGYYFGGRDHTTVMHAYEKIRKSKDEDKGRKSLLTKIETELRRC